MWDKSPVLFADVVEKAAVKRVKDIATDMHTALVDKSPVDSSRYVSNHKVSLDTPDWSHDDNKFVGRSGALAQGMAVINGMPVDRLHSVHLTNTIKYSKYLEKGHSSFAPNGVYLPVFLGVSMFYR